MGSQTLTYTFLDGTVTDTINLTIATPATNSSGNGLGYNVTAVSGSVGGIAIDGEVGSGGVEAPIAGLNGSVYDNVVFASDLAGGSAAKDDHQTGSKFGIDDQGIEFKAGSLEYNLFYETIDGNLGFTLFNNSTLSNTTLALLSSNAPCFCAGTRIETMHGEVAVEQLAAGDVVVTAFGQHRPVRWVGHRVYAGRFLRANPNVHPIRFHAGSLGHGLPRRDLLVSPEHAMFLDGVLIPARHLVNKTTVVVEAGFSRVEYYHVELDSHDILLAEGSPSESYADNGDSARFHNAGERVEQAWPVPLCAPRVEGGSALETAKLRLNPLVEQMRLQRADRASGAHSG